MTRRGLIAALMLSASGRVVKTQTSGRVTDIGRLAVQIACGDGTASLQYDFSDDTCGFSKLVILGPDHERIEWTRDEILAELRRHA